VGPEQALLHFVLQIARRGEMDQPMRVEGVFVPSQLQAVSQPLARGEIRHPLLHRIRLLQADAVLAGQHVAGGFARRLGGVGIQLEAAPPQ
jgi:hypothetical protein